jgi:putative ABC transport system permease protein
MLSQTSAITGLNLKSIPERWGPSLVIVVGLAGVVAVFTALFAMAEGLRVHAQGDGRADVALVLRGGSQGRAELGHVARRGDADQAGARASSATPRIRPQASAELIVITELLKPGEKTGMNVTLRGVEQSGSRSGRRSRSWKAARSRPGCASLMVGKGVTQQFVGAKVGNVLHMRGSDWTVVGMFDSGDAHNS